MNESIIASSEGDGGPYVFVPKQFADALCSHINAQRHSCALARDAAFLGSKPTDCVLETPEHPQEIEPAIDAWFNAQQLDYAKSSKPAEGEPTRIEWEFEPPEERSR